MKGWRAEAAAQMKAALRAKDVAELARLRAAIAGEKKARNSRLKELSKKCASAREERAQSAKARRDALRALVQAERAEDRAQCAASKDRAREQVAKALRVLDEQGAEVREMARLTRATKAPKLIMRAESDDEVRASVEARMMPVWEVRKSKTRPTARASRLEVFQEWAEENKALVAEILERHTDKELRRLMQEERRLAALMRQRDRYKGEGVEHRLSAYEDEHGAF